MWEPIKKKNKKKFIYVKKDPYVKESHIKQGEKKFEILDTDGFIFKIIGCK